MLTVSILSGLALLLALPAQCTSPPSRPEKLPICRAITFNVSASATQLVLSDFRDVSGEGAVLGLVAKIPGILANPILAVKSGSYNISGTLCKPTKHVPDLEDYIQVLVHGATYTKEYWSTGAWSSKNTPQYSWSRYANYKGYHTLAIDRLGNGQSSRPDSS